MMNWNLIKQDYVINLDWLRVKRKEYRLPRRDEVGDFFVFEYSDWVNVLPITGNGQIVLIKQYRPGLERVLWELPAGCVEGDETPLEAAKRELLEETGYQGESWTELGCFSPNPGTHNNLSYSYLALGVEKVSEQNLDCTEDIDVFVLSPQRVNSMLMEGKFLHSLHVNALLLYFSGRSE